MVRRNRKPNWIIQGNKYCVECGNNFKEGETIFNNSLSQYCSNCGKAKEKHLKLTGALKVEWTEFRSNCVRCSKLLENGDKVLFGIYCTTCGSKWIKERDIRMKNQLRKARNIPIAEKKK